MKDLSFSLKLKELPVKIETTKGIEKTYTLKELTGAGRDAYMDDFSTRTIRDKDGKPTAQMTKTKNFQAGLLHSCLFDDKDKPVDVEVIQSWPSNVVSDLFLAAQELSGLGRAAGEEAKNESGVKS